MSPSYGSWWAPGPYGPPSFRNRLLKYILAGLELDVEPEPDHRGGQAEDRLRSAQADVLEYHAVAHAVDHGDGSGLLVPAEHAVRVLPVDERDLDRPCRARVHPDERVE